MGHGDKIFTSDIQNKLIENGILWLLRPSKPNANSQDQNW
jgi:hypothetical protein